MEPLTYILIAIGLIAGAAVGWFIRHNFLNRRLAQSQLQLEELRALQLNVEHELSSLRQKLIHHSTEQENLSTKVEKAQSLNSEKMKAFEDLKSRFDLIAEDNETLQEQVTYLESERLSYQQYREQTQNKIDALKKQNEALSLDLEDLRKKTPREAGVWHESGGIPRVRRVDPREWRELQKSQPKESVAQKDETSRLQPRPSKSTDRFNSRETEAPEKTPAAPPPKPKPAQVSAVTPHPKPEPVSTPGFNNPPEPRDDIDVWDDESDDASDFEQGTDPGVFPKPFMDEELPEPKFEPELLSEPEPQPEAAIEPVFTPGTATDQMQTVSWKAGQGPVTAEVSNSEPESPPPPQPRAAPSREPVNAPENASEPAEDQVVRKTPEKKRKKLRKKKKPGTVRVDITSSDIIDSFKRELGLPEE